MAEQDLSVIAAALDATLAQCDLTNTTSDKGTGDLPDGYYLCEVEKAELVSSKSGYPMVKFRYKVVENGYKSVVDDKGNDILVEAKGTMGNPIFMNYVLSNASQIPFFVSDMLKFANTEDLNKPLLADTEEEAKYYFTNTELLVQALDIISMGCRIYIMVQSVPNKENKDVMDKKYNPIKWKRASELGLPV